MRSSASRARRNAANRKCAHDEAALTEAIVRLATQYGRYGYRRIRRLLVDEGWRVSVKRVYRIWRREGLKVPKKQPKRGRLWLNDGSCIRLRPERPNHVWSYDFVQDRTEDGRRFRMLTVIDEFTRRCLAIVVGAQAQVRRRAPLPDRSVRRARSARAYSFRQWPGVRRRATCASWLGRIGVKTLFIEPGSPWENGYCESFNSKLRDELLAGEHVLDAARGEGAHRAVAAALQCRSGRIPRSAIAHRRPRAILPPASALPYAALRPAQTLAKSGRILT